MDKTYRAEKLEDGIYRSWEKSGAFNPKESSGEPFTIIMPPPNANASLHAGHAMYTVEDILIRWKRMQGFSALWVPGMDHAGFETQFVYEKELAKKGKSRLDFDRETLYQNIAGFVKKNSGLIYQQFRRLGFSADWDRSVYAAEPRVIDFVYQTFKKMEKEGLVYRDNYIVNYCVHCGTSLAELEVKHVERTDELYYIRYPLADKTGYIVVATTRPEPIFADTHLAVHPKDKKNKHLVGRKVLNPLTDAAMEIIADEFVDPQFGTGIVKLTPAHDQNDFEVAKKHGLPVIEAIDWKGRIMSNGGKYAGMKIKAARGEVLKDLEAKKLIAKVDKNYLHSVIACYKCGRDLEPLTIPNWFIRVTDLKEKVKDAVNKNRVKFYPARFKRHMLQWLEVMHDWPISRQIVWAIRIPVWYRVDPAAANIWVWWLDEDKKLHQGSVNQFLEDGVKLEQIKKGLQKVLALSGSKQPQYVVSATEPKDGKMYLPETDVFDTWFSSGQWPLVTLTPDEFKTRFPTDVMGTLSDILKFWVSRMIMFSLYLKQAVPFKDVYLWSMVADSKGQKMSKSKGNVINPIDLVSKYGADALRLALIYGTATGSKIILSDDKVRAMRNFANKIWNAGRFLTMASLEKSKKTNDQQFQEHLKQVTKETTDLLQQYQLGLAAEKLYEEFWHWFCDQKIEEAKAGKISQPVLLEGLRVFLKLLHPFVPFVTEAVWQQLPRTREKLLIESVWPSIS